MLKYLRKQSKKIGLPPGTVIHVGERKVDKVRIRIIDYTESELNEREVENIEEVFRYKDTSSTTWINIDGLHQPEIIEKIGAHFNIHSLVLEDIVNTGQRPKFEEYDDYLFFVFKMYHFDEKTLEIKSEQVSLIIGEHYLISFQETIGDMFDPIRERLKKWKGRIRKMSTDYLAYAIIDTIVDSYYLIIESIGGKIESLEEELLTSLRQEQIQTIKLLKREILFFRRSVAPLKESLNIIIREECSLLSEPTRIFFKDVYDHLSAIIDSIDLYRDMLTGMLEIFLSSVSNKMNEVMKVLTLVASIFIPLTFIAGIYGMNFEFIPELGWRWGYLMVWTLFIVIGITFAVYFKRKNWF